MDEQEIPRYLYLIEELLRCTPGREETVLSDNPDLLYANLLRMIKERAVVEKDRATVNRLNAIANQVEKKLNLLSVDNCEASANKDRLNFIFKVLKSTRDSQGNSQVVDPILERNLAQLDDRFAEQLRTWATARLSEVGLQQAERIAVAIGNFGNLIQQFHLGNKAANVEISLACYKISLTVFTRHSHPETWAMTQNNLGNAYFNRIKGDTAQNLEIAIAAYQKALEVRTKDAFPNDWATTQNNLGSSYSNRILGDTAENLELAIAAYQKALEVRTKDAFPTGWAMTQNNLGNAYSDRILGDTAENLEMAIAAFQNALLVYTKGTFPNDWATTQNNLGATYRDRIKGDTAENLEMAIAAYEKALKVRTKEAFPNDWAMTQNNLGLAYSDRILGDTAENLELAIAAYQNALFVYTKDAFPNNWATIQNNLGIAYKNRIKGDTAENLEMAIAAYEKALEVRTKDAFPNDWAMIQNNLGIAYKNRIKGDTAKNLEIAIAAFQNALLVRTKDAFPKDWATTQNNLGSAYSDRIKGDTAENLEIAIAAYKKALEVRTKEAFPTDWATTQNNLGIGYKNRIKGDTAKNLEIAIAAYKKALEVRAKEAFPSDWAMIQNNLGNAYSERILGDTAENLEMAIAAYEKADKIYTKEAFPTNWATIQNNLGLAYRNRINGDTAENLEMAINAYQKALEVRTKEAFPNDWAGTQNNLGNAYKNRINGDTAENLEIAIAANQYALEIYTKEAFPSDWAGTQNNLGIAYSDRIKGETAENLEMAIAAFKKALEVHTKDAFPNNWAMTQNNLGSSYSNRIKGETAENLKLAIAAYEKALEVYTKEANPINCLNASRSLGKLHFKEGNWQPAIAAYKQAINAVELSRSWANTDNRRQQIIAEAIEVYQKLVQAYINTEQWDKAIETVERSKARNLVELLTNRDLSPKGDVPPEIIAKLDELRRNIPSLERQLQVATDQLSGNSDEQQRPSLEKSQKRLQQELQQSRQQLDEVLNQIKPFDSSFSLTQKVETIRFEEIQNLIGEQTATIQWYFTDNSIITSIITHQRSQPTIISSLAEEREAFVNWTIKYLRAYYEQNQQWQNDLPFHLAELAKILKIDQTLAEIENIFAPQGIKCDRLILIPHRFLHLLPLHALPLANGDLVCDKFLKGVSYAPSCQLLQLTQKRQRPHFNHLFAIQNPTEDLVFTNLEVETVRSFFSPATVLAAQVAREAEVKTHPELSLAHCNHFSCHGEFNLESPLKSALRLAETKQSNSENTEDGLLTLAEIFALNLTQSRLVTLSACETGISDLNSISDEYVSLPSGFLFAGSPSVVSSLWKVDELATAFLMIKFYQNLKELPFWEAGDVAIALKQAQVWLRKLTGKDAEEFLDTLQPQIDQVLAELPPGYDFEFEDAVNEFRQQIPDQPNPFTNPFYWAAFTATGY
ncbi:MAG: CHAT domain-containing protein [Okeania sp. SIO3I5]|uniref:CHAT domain-containing protein n=1 Tax=Okeania sp. SIO3I5 TaxID=2607805 RepID=UPI0013BB2A34|nr:CHAT domain-containing protein [Okeania sp. SIO3I5]NEQ41181.1 CHAT domain-containing protein [Okeania sp. SIO3I5]